MQVIFASLAVLFMNMMLGLAVGATAAPTAKGVYRMRVGDITVITLSDGINRRTVEQQSQLLHGNRERMKGLLADAYPDGNMESTVNAFLIHAGAKLILIDAGMVAWAVRPWARCSATCKQLGMNPSKSMKYI